MNGAKLTIDPVPISAEDISEGRLRFTMTMTVPIPGNTRGGFGRRGLLVMLQKAAIVKLRSMIPTEIKT